MRNLIIFFTLAVLLSGCAVSIESRLLERGEYVDAYIMNRGGSSSIKDESTNRVIEEIREKTGGAKNEKFKEMLSNYIESSHQNEWLFVALPNVFTKAEKDGLINSAHHYELNDKLLYLLGKASIESPSLLKNATIQASYPELSRYRGKIAIAEFEKLEADQTSTFKKYISLYRLFIETNDSVLAQRVLAPMRTKAEKQLKSGVFDTLGVSGIETFFEYINLTNDRTLDELILKNLNNFKLSRSDLTNGEISKLFPVFAKHKLESNIIKLNITSQNDEFVVGEIVEELKKLNEWLEVSDDAKRKLTIGRIRFQETRTNPTNMTETVQSPSFVTLLMIPKNASVLFDYSISEYSVQWSMSVMDSQNKMTKTFSGQRNGKKVECRNMRYQNVFGGTGSLYSMPNDAVASFCQSSTSPDFDGIRVGALGEIANEINKTFLAAK